MRERDGLSMVEREGRSERSIEIRRGIERERERTDRMWGR